MHLPLPCPSLLSAPSLFPLNSETTTGLTKKWAAPKPFPPPHHHPPFSLLLSPPPDQAYHAAEKTLGHCTAQTDDVVVGALLESDGPAVGALRRLQPPLLRQLLTCTRAFTLHILGGDSHMTTVATCSPHPLAPLRLPPLGTHEIPRTFIETWIHAYDVCRMTYRAFLWNRTLL